MSTWTLATPLWLGVLALVPVAAWLRARRGLAAFVVPFACAWQGPGPPRARRWPALCAYAALGLLGLALARPQRLVPTPPERRPGHDIVLAIDLSTSMYAEDFERDGRTLNRLQAVKPIIEAFINRRPDDRIGIVAFAGRAYTFAPLTLDHGWLRRQTARLAIGSIEDGTAIGDALAVALSRLQQGARHREAERLGSFIVLLTDGSSNRGSLDPRQAAGLVAEAGAAIYAIGAGADGLVPMPVFDHAGKRSGTELRRAEIDDLLLRDLAETTQGRFFRATDARAIEAAFDAIDQATRNDLNVPARRTTQELFALFAAAAACCLAVAVAGTAANAGPTTLGLKRIALIGSRLQTAAPSVAARRPWRLLAALVLAGLALADPRWGEGVVVRDEPARELLIALDLSRSMLVADADGTRLQRARTLIATMLDSLEGERVGLVLFAGVAYVQVPLSSDHTLLREFLPMLEPGYLPQGGSNHAAMLQAARDGFSEEPRVDRTLVVLSDGESTTDGWREAGAALNQRGVATLALGIGTVAGGDVPPTAEGEVSPGRSRLEPATLQALAAGGEGGVYRQVTAATDVGALLRAHLRRSAQTRWSREAVEGKARRFQWLLAPAFVLALWGVWREIALRPHRRVIRRPASAAEPVMAASFVAVVVAGVIAGVGVHPAAQAHEEGHVFGSDATAADRLQWLVEDLAQHRGIDARDLALFAGRTINYGLETLAAGHAVPDGAVRDALQAVDIGERLNAQHADWTTLRGALNRLRAHPAGAAAERPPEQKKEALDEEDRASQTNGQGSQQTASESLGQGGLSRNSGALGELQQETGGRRRERATPAPAGLRAGAGAPGTTAASTRDPLRALTLKRYRDVVNGDRPGVLFQALTTDRNPQPAGGRDW